MKPTLLVCDLEYAKKIKELGVVQESCFYWRKQHHVPFKDQEFKLFSDKGCDFPATYSAWTTTELGIMLPKIIELGEWPSDWYYFTLFADHCIERCLGYRNTITGKDLWWKNSDEPKTANDYAECLIHLIENKHITVEEINERLKGVRE
jgi:hypothetical protein